MQLVLLIVAALGSGAVAAWSLSDGHPVAAVAFAIAGGAWAVAAFDRSRTLRVAPEPSASVPVAAADHADAGVDGAHADAIDRVAGPGEVPRQWTVAADTTRGTMRRGALLLSDRALYCTFEAGPSIERRTARIPIAAITDISRLPPRRLGIRFRTPNGDASSIVVDLPARDDANALVGALVEARRRIVRT